jgi:hypothetical protein
LNLNNNNISSLDLSNLPELEEVSCSSNLIVEVIANNCPSLTQLTCDHNAITNLNISDAIALEALDCSYNDLTSLNINGLWALEEVYVMHNYLTLFQTNTNTALGELDCKNNEITILDLSNNLNLWGLNCNNNQIAELDLRVNTALVSIYCDDNSLSSLNVSNGYNNVMPNANFSAINNPDLTCISVDDPAWSTANWSHIDEGVGFSEDCTIGVTQIQETSISCYPNPVTNILTISLPNSVELAKIEIVDTSGKTVNTVSNQQSISFENLSNGLYFIKVLDVKGNIYIERVFKM